MKIKENYSLKDYNTFAIAVKCKYFAEAATEEELLDFVRTYEWNPEEILILGGGSNFLFTEDFEGTVFYPAMKGIEIIEEENKVKSAEAKVVKILKHEKDTIVGVFQNNRNFGFVVPDDRNFGTDIFIAKKDMGKARNNHKVLVKITKYPLKRKKSRRKNYRSIRKC